MWSRRGWEIDISMRRSNEGLNRTRNHAVHVGLCPVDAQWSHIFPKLSQLLGGVSYVRSE